jgi:DNA sulfur modification protein DndB
LAEFEKDAIAVMITVESDINQIHQDFADCSKTRPLPASQLAAYDRRNPANGLVLDLIDKCPFFMDKIDSTSKTLSKNSANLFLTNQVRQMVKELLVGQYSMQDDAFEAKAKQLLGSSEDERYKRELEKFVAYINHVTEKIPVWKEMAALPEGTPRNKVTEKRSEGWVCLMATGLVIIGRIGHELFKNQHKDWQSYADKLGTIDWHKNAHLWDDNIIQNGKVMTQQGPVKGAVDKVRIKIGLPLKELERAKAA